MYNVTARKPGGFIIITGPDGVIEKETVQCCHCGKHWTVNPGSGNIRGYCMECNARTCGHTDCGPCYPFEQRLDDAEKGLLVPGLNC